MIESGYNVPLQGFILQIRLKYVIVDISIISIEIYIHPLYDFLAIGMAIGMAVGMAMAMAMAIVLK